MANHLAGMAPTSITLEGTILRADGTTEDLGVIAYTHRNPVRRLLGQQNVRGGSVLRTILGRAPKITDHKEG
jgi:hypothetical protein